MSLTVHAHLTQPRTWECLKEDRESTIPGPGARKREAEKMHPDPLMPGTDACPLSQGKGDPQDGLRNRSDMVQSVGNKL